MTSRSGFTVVAATAVLAGGIAWIFSPGLPVAQAQGPNDVVARAFEAKLDKLEGKADKLESKLDRWTQAWDKWNGDLNEKLDNLGSKANASFPIYNKLEAKLDKLESKLDHPGGGTAGGQAYEKLEAKLDKLEGKLDKLQGGAAGGTTNGPALEVYKKLEAKLDKLEGKADKLEGKLDKLQKVTSAGRK